MSRLSYSLALLIVPAIALVWWLQPSVSAKKPQAKTEQESTDHTVVQPEQPDPAPITLVSHLQPQENNAQRSTLYPSNSEAPRTPSFKPNVEPASTRLSSQQDKQFGSQQPQRQDVPTVDTDSRRSGGSIETPSGSVQFVDEITLPALEAGAIKEIYVEEGQFIEAGTVVGQIDDALLRREAEQVKLAYDIARTKATSDVAVQAARAEVGLRQSEFDKIATLYRKYSASDSELEQARFEKEIAEFKTEKAELDKEVAFKEAKKELTQMETAEFRIGRHVLKSDYSAYVVEIVRKPQEYVNVGDDVMRLGRMDEMWVTSSIKANEVDPYEVLHRPVTVTLTLADGTKEEFKGRVDQIPLDQTASDSFIVKVKVKNRKAGDVWLLLPRRRVSLKIHLDQNTLPSSTDQNN